MTLSTSILAGALCLVGVTVGAPAQAQYPAYPPYAGEQIAAAPPAWNYDPYTSGLTACPQWRHGDLGNCHDWMPPTFGQPDYRPR